jgi:NodT family efflux transporter outer membrane factor (OMF) lipoprotein
MIRMLKPVALAATLVTLLSACSLVPTYQRPASPVPEQWSTGSAGSIPADAAPALVNWETYFPDARLQSLIRASLANNRDLRVAVLNIEQTRAQYQIQRAALFPQVGVSVSGTRGTATNAPYPVYSAVSGGLSLSAFEIDLFGRVRALTDAAAATLLATQEARKTTQISLVASVASTWYALWADRWLLALADQTLQARDASLKLLQLKYDNGVLNELDLRTGQSLVQAARVSRAQADRQYRQDLNSLALLVGQQIDPATLPPAPSLGERSLDDVDSIPRLGGDTLWPALAELPVGLPSQVLLARPDITQAEQQLIAANANIGAARAAMFPSISLTANAGRISNSLSGLFDDGRKTWGLTGSLLAPIFDMGRTRAGVEVAQASRDIAVAQYEKAIQSAFREVSDALVSRETYADQALAQQAQADAENDRLKLSALRYRSGVASQLDLLDAQRSLFAAQQALIQAQLASQQANITLFKTLGGGWDRDAASAAPAAAAAASGPAS